MKNRKPEEWVKNCVSSVLTRPKMHNQTPRHFWIKDDHWITQHGGLSGMSKKTKERTTKTKFYQKVEKVKEKFWGLENIKIWGYTVIWDFEKRKERTTETKLLSESFKSKNKNPKVMKILKLRGN